MPDTDRITLSDFITREGIRMTADRTTHNPFMSDAGHPMDHWRVTLHAGELGVNWRSLDVVFSMGPGHHGAAPELTDVLDCLASDAAGIENALSFEGWAEEYGFDTDSRRAEQIFKATAEQTRKLRAFLWPDAYETLLYYVDRD
jgi:hypothetical protein